MKHYFLPRGGEPGAAHEPPWTSLRVHAPLAARIERLVPEWAGSQVWLAARDSPGLVVRLFHVHVAPSLHEGQEVGAGQPLGRHASEATMSDIAVAWRSGAGERLVSLFDVMSDAAFADYQARGVPDRAALVIPAGLRDSDPLTCAGEAFTRASRLPDWVSLEELPPRAPATGPGLAPAATGR